MELQGFGFAVHHRQADATALGLVQQFTILFPAVQCRQGVKLAFDGPVRANDGVGAAHQPDAHDALQQVGALQPIGHVEALLNQFLALGLFVHDVSGE